MTGEEYREQQIKILAREFLKGHMRFIDLGDYNHERHYICKYCRHGINDYGRFCRNEKYFKHKLDCPVLIAKDILR